MENFSFPSKSNSQPVLSWPDQVKIKLLIGADEGG